MDLETTHYFILKMVALSSIKGRKLSFVNHGWICGRSPPSLVEDLLGETSQGANSYVSFRPLSSIFHSSLEFYVRVVIVLLLE